ncbi:MAG: response regulator [Anaerolineaceae bacterium]|nr:MAG: response regulator [Anaerolineaceae bacterium]
MIRKEDSMYHTLIVDDEPLMRKYLGENLSKIFPDFQVTGIACDGLEAVELIKKQHFDLVISDIRMPEMDGINLAKYIFDAGLRTKVAIISGYNEFEYARLAIKYNVSDYLLKPLSDSQIRETLVKIKSELDEDVLRNHIQSPTLYENASETDLKLSLLSAIINRENTVIQNLYNLIEKNNISFTGSFSTLLILSIDDLYLLLNEKTVSENTSYSLRLYQHCVSYCIPNNLTAVKDDYGNTVILINADSEEELSALVNNTYSRIKKEWPFEQIKLIASYGNIVKDMLNLATSYDLAMQSSALVLKNETSPISSSYYISQSRFIHELTTICDSLASNYIAKNWNKAISDLYLYVKLFSDPITIARFLRFGTYLIRFLARKCNIKSDQMIFAFQVLTDHIDEWINIPYHDTDTAQEILLRVYKALDQEDSFRIVPETTHITESAKEYICTHYQEQISLSQVAEHLNVTPSYLSDLFHKNIGEPYTKFITRIRMEQAALMLKINPNEKIYNIASKTGFVSAKHFNSVFKKYYGVTPTEYISK